MTQEFGEFEWTVGECYALKEARNEKSKLWITHFQLARLVNRDRKESAVSAPNTAHWTAVYSSKTEHDENREGREEWSCCMQSTSLPLVASFIDIFRIAVIFRCHQPVSR